MCVTACKSIDFLCICHHTLLYRNQINKQNKHLLYCRFQRWTLYKLRLDFHCILTTANLIGLVCKTVISCLFKSAPHYKKELVLFVQFTISSPSIVIWCILDVLDYEWNVPFVTVIHGNVNSWVPQGDPRNPGRTHPLLKQWWINIAVTDTNKLKFTVPANLLNISYIKFWFIIDNSI